MWSQSSCYILYGTIKSDTLCNTHTRFEIFLSFLVFNIRIYELIRLFSGQLVLTLANLEGEETFEASLLGQAEEVVQERICDDELILIKG